MKCLKDRLLDAAQGLENENYHTEASLMREAAGVIVAQPAPDGRTRHAFDPVLVNAMARLIVDNQLHGQNREDTVGVLMRCGAFRAEPETSAQDKFVADLAAAIDECSSRLGTWRTEAYSVEKSKFGDLAVGEHFVCWPIPGDNHGHGGYLGQHRLFVKTGDMSPANTPHSGVARNGSGTESTFPKSMPVIRVVLG